MKMFLSVALISVIFTGCSAFRPHVGIKQMKGFVNEDGTDQHSVFWAFFDSNYRASVISRDQDGNVRVLSEVPPDTALTAISEFAGKLNYEGITAEMSAKITESLTVLGQRTVAVNILRDALYRLAELSASQNLTDLEKDLFTQILTAAKDIAIAEKQNSRAEVLRLQMNLLEKAQELRLNPESINSIFQDQPKD